MSDAKPTPYHPKFLGNYWYLYNGLYKTLVFFRLEEFEVQAYEEPWAKESSRDIPLNWIRNYTSYGDRLLTNDNPCWRAYTGIY